MSFSHEETWSDVTKNCGHEVSKSLHACDHTYLDADDANSVLYTKMIWKVFDHNSPIVHQHHNIPSLSFNPLDAGRRYTGILQSLKRRQTPVYRGYVNIQASPDPGIPGLRKHTSLARPRYTGIIF